jgi:hypothetical protein
MATGNNNTAESTPQQPKPPRLIILKLHESPHKDGNYEKYNMQWILDADNNNDDSMIQNGDMLYIPELASGAGEMEGVRFVGTGSDSFVLLGAGIESPVFPRALAELKSPQKLRQDYEMLLEIVLQQQGFSLVDLFGGKEVVEEFWASPDVGRNTKETQGEWHIPLAECTVLPTHE